MANRAYLYSSDNPEEWECPGRYLRPGEPYYDSRWLIPLAWLYFFDPEDVSLIEVEQWFEVRLRVEKKLAIERFDTRLPLLKSRIDGRIDETMLDTFMLNVETRSGHYLYIEPNEVLGGFYSESDETHATQIQDILALIDTPPGLDPDLEQAIEYYVGSLDHPIEEREVRIIGYTYWE